MKVLSLTLALLSILFIEMSAQCPPAAASNVHVVQRGETLFGIAKKYKISVENLCKWNNRRQTDVLEVCTPLAISPVISTSESVPPTAQTTPKPTENTSETTKPFQFYVKQGGGQHIVQYGETVENIARLYGYTEEYFRQFNSLAVGKGVVPGTVLRSTDCTCPEKVGGTVTVEAEVPPAEPSPTPTSKSTAPPSSTSSMTSEEMEMVQEINLLRSNPAAYIKFVEEYIAYMQVNGEFGNSIETARELIDVLHRTPRLSVLQPTECVYQAAKKHGQDQLRAGTTNHQGSDGSWPWDRILRECNGFQDGNENLVGGLSDIRRAVILLLVDDGIPNRGHRETLLNPHWKYVACYKIGQVGEIPNCWVQNFAM